MRWPRLMPPNYLLIAILAMVLLHFLLPIARVIPYPWNLLGCALAGAGILLGLPAARLFQRAKTTIRPFEASSALVTTGPFRLTRNPIYLGFVLILLGLAIFLGSLSPYLAVVAFAILIDRRFIRVEEQMLEAKFGPAFLDFKARTRRWL